MILILEEDLFLSNFSRPKKSNLLCKHANYRVEIWKCVVHFSTKERSLQKWLFDDLQNVLTLLCQKIREKINVIKCASMLFCHWYSKYVIIFEPNNFYTFFLDTLLLSHSVKITVVRVHILKFFEVEILSLFVVLICYLIAVTSRCFQVCSYISQKKLYEQLINS